MMWGLGVAAFWKTLKEEYMAQWHLEDIENSLKRTGWIISERIEPNEKESFIGGWVIKRASQRFIDFDGIFDGMGNTIKDPSIDKAYACRIRETDISLYFYKKGKKWDENLKRFAIELNELK